MNIHFLCTANICRSPLAEHYLRHLADQLGVARLEVSSGGMHDYSGRVADPVMAAIAAARGLDLSRHVSRRSTRADLDAADRIVVMERKHRSWALDQQPNAQGKVSLLREWLDGPLDVPDPIGGSRAEYDAALGVLFAAVERLAFSLKYPR